MCNFLSAWVTKDGTVFCEPLIDSHETIAKLFKIKERNGPSRSCLAARVEYTPPEKDGVKQYFDLDNYTLTIDEDRTPDWFDDERKAHVERELKRILAAMVVSDDARPILIGKCLMFADGGKAEALIGCRLLVATAKAYLRGADLSRANLSRAYLSGADLSRADLSRADLSRANLGGADLGRANLSGADLGRANLIGANLGGADLRGSYLSGADLGRANLSGADLRGADLRGAYLSGADLSRANLSGAYLSRADLSRADLSGAYRPSDSPAGYAPDSDGYLVKDKEPANV